MLLYLIDFWSCLLQKSKHFWDSACTKLSFCFETEAVISIVLRCFLILEIIPSRNNLVATIAQWGPEFYIKFNLMILEFKAETEAPHRPFRNVFRFVMVKKVDSILIIFY